MVCKLKARVNLHGILNLDKGYFVEDEEFEEPIPESKDADAMETDDKTKGDAPKTRKVKRTVTKGDLPLSAGTASLDQASKDLLFEQEGQMISEDKLVAETEDKKNELESEIYSMRSRIDEPYSSNGYSDFASEQEKEKIREKCSQLEDWLYDDGDDASKGQYIAKLDELRASAGPIIGRFNDKRQEEEEARRKQQEEAAAKRKVEDEARRKAEAEKRKTEEANKTSKPDEEMKEAPVDADGTQPAEVEEA